MAKRNKLAVFSVVALGMMFFAEQNKACTRAVYLGPDDMIVTGRTMDWKEDPQSNIYLFPRGMEKHTPGMTATLHSLTRRVQNSMLLIPNLLILGMM